MASGLRPGAVDRARLPVQQRDRRAALSALALLLVVAGALGSALVVYRSGHRTDVLVAAHDIKPGQLMAADDFSVARAASDSGRLIPAADKPNFVGAYAAVAVPVGTVLNPLMFLGGHVVPPDGVIVGVTLPANQRPAVGLSAGETVRVYLIPKDAAPAVPTLAAGATAVAGAAPLPPGAQVLVDIARVVEVSGSATGDTADISLLLKASDAQAVVLAAAEGEVAVARLPVTSVPPIDLLTRTTATPTPVK